MFPTPLKHRSKAANISYRIAVPVTLLIWLLPLIAVALTSVRSIADINQGNYWGIPSEWNLIENYTEVFRATPMWQYLLNTLKITIPTVIGNSILSTLTSDSLIESIGCSES